MYKGKTDFENNFTIPEACAIIAAEVIRITDAQSYQNGFMTGGTGMICKRCNSIIDDNAQKCPCCGESIAENTDSGFPDPAAPKVDLSKPSGNSSGQAQNADPQAAQNPQPEYNRNSYDQPYGAGDSDEELQKKIHNVWILCLVGMILSVLMIFMAFTGCCCCFFIPGPIAATAGFITLHRLKNQMSRLPEASQKEAKNARIFCYVSFGAFALSLLICIVLFAVLIANGTFADAYREALESVQNAD